MKFGMAISDCGLNARAAFGGESKAGGIQNPEFGIEEGRSGAAEDIPNPHSALRIPQ